MDWRFVLSLLFAIVVSIFALQNSGSVNISFFQAQVNMSQALIILISAVLGAVIVLMLSAIRWVKWKSKSKTSLKTISKLEEEIKGLKLKLDYEAKTTAGINLTAAGNSSPDDNSNEKPQMPEKNELKENG